jgi:hypothetical protein
MAAWSTGAFSKSYGCTECAKMPDRKKLYGCVDKALRYVEVEEYEGIEYKYYNCPLQFVPPNIWEFLKMYKFMKDFPASVPSYKDVCSRFLTAYQYYESQKNIYLAKKV